MIILELTDLFLITFLSAFLIVIAKYKIEQFLGKKFNSELGKDSVIFNEDQKDERRLWRKKRIDYLVNQIINGNGAALEIKIVVGEFNSGARDTVMHALRKSDEVKVNVTVIGGPKIWCKDKKEIINLLELNESVKYYSLPQRPRQHFMIFGLGDLSSSEDLVDHTDLFVEKFHKHNESRETVGIIDAKLNYKIEYNKCFKKLLTLAKEVNSNDVNSMECYTV